MRVLPSNLKKDDENLLYLDIEDLKIEELFFQELKRMEYSMTKFYSIDGNKDYILKSTPYPLILNKTRTINMLRYMDYYRDAILHTEFPIGYYRGNNKFKGTIVPYYENGISIREFLRCKNFESLVNYYNKDNDEIANLMKLYIDILNIIEELYNENIIYFDIVHGGNFVLWQDSVRLIDFEPGLITLTKNKERHYKRTIGSLCYLINCMSQRFNIRNCLLDPGRDFEETKDNVKKMEKYLRRDNGI